jgi:DinB superfamily
VDDEWSFTETLRHLVFATDSWISRVILGEARPYHPLALPPSFVTDLVGVGIDDRAEPTFDDVLKARTDRQAVVRHLLEDITSDELARRCDQNPAPGYPADTTQLVLDCIHGVIDEEWAHHGYAVRDLGALTAST